MNRPLSPVKGRTLQSITVFNKVLTESTAVHTIRKELTPGSGAVLCFGAVCASTEPGILEVQSVSKRHYLMFLKAAGSLHNQSCPLFVFTTSTQDISSITFQNVVMLKLNCPV